ncbi:MAG: hypothetical protein ACK5LK_01925 [Chthoniobacterales bacterium]
MYCKTVLTTALIGSGLFLHAANAQILESTWTVAGGGIDPNNYGGDYRPATLYSDSASSSASIALSGLTSGGIGSGGYPNGYGGIYTFYSDNPSFTLSTSTILGDLNQITFSFEAGGGDPVRVEYLASSITLNYNASNPSISSTSFTKGASFPAPPGSPVEGLTLTPYTWTWSGLAELGTTSNFSFSWDAQSQHHVWFQNVNLTQAIPEPSVVTLLLLSSGLFFKLKRKH